MNRREFFEINAAAASGAALQAGPAASAAAGRATMRAGFAERDITPKVDPKEIHDPLKVRASVFDDGRNRVAIVGVDAIGVARAVVLEARRRIQAATGLPPENVLVGASHTHSIHRGEWGEADGDPRSNYGAHVAQQIAAAVLEAVRSLAEVRCGVGSGFENQVAFNRRLRMKNGLTYTHPGQGNPDIERFAGPTDPEVGVVGAWDARDRLVGCVVNYCCHATTSPPGISANWIYYMEQIVRGIDRDAVVVFTQGACGDVTQVNNLSPYEKLTGDGYARFVGRRVGAEAVKVLASMHPGRLAPVAGRSKVWPIPYRTPSPERVRKAREMVARGEKKANATDYRFAQTLLSFVERQSREKAAEVEVQAIQLGPAIFVSNPAELFCQFGLDIKEGSPFRFTYPVELANGSVGYVPTEESFGPHGGGYETRLGVSRIALDAGRQMVAAGLDLARSLEPGPVPMPPLAEPFSPVPGNIGTHPWSFGNVPPEVS